MVSRSLGWAMRGHRVSVCRGGSVSGVVAVACSRSTALEHLAGGGARAARRSELDVARDLVPGQPLVEVGAQRELVEVGAGAGARRTRSRPRPTVGRARPTTARPLTSASSAMRVLDLGRVDVLAAGDDHVLDAVDDVGPAVVVDPDHVAGAEPAVGEAPRRSPRAGPSSRRRRAGRGPAARPGSPVRDRLAVGVSSATSVKKCGTPAEPAVTAAPSGRARNTPGRGLGHAVALLEHDAAVQPGLRDRLGDRRAAADHVAQRRQVGAGPSRGARTSSATWSAPPRTTVTRWRSIRSRKPPASNFGTTTTVPPLSSVGSVTWFSPVDVEQRRDAQRDVAC